jgi:5-methylcytosine-specific restriction endonuclease McrA
MGYREDYFKNKSGLFGKYKCKKCKKWFNKEDIDVDHRISKRNGGTDNLYNLQAMCKHCNRSKKDVTSKTEVASTLIRSTIAGDLGGQIGSIAKRKVKDALHIKYKR